MKVPAEKGTIENTNREGNHDNSYWGEPCDLCMCMWWVSTGREYSTACNGVVCFHGRHSSSESDTAEKRKKKRGKEQLDKSERQK